MILPLILFIAIALVFNFLINILMASFAFWVTDIRLFSTFVGLIMGFLAGEVLPLDVLPVALKKIALFLPFQYALYFPIQVYQGKLTHEQIRLGLIFSFFWTVFFLFLIMRLWRKGVKKYEAVGQ